MRKKFLFEGNVQGVGFRFTAKMLAKKYEITGYVKNRIDGKVEIITEGDAQEIQDYIDRLNTRMGVNISSVSDQEQPETGEFSSFRIKY